MTEPHRQHKSLLRRWPQAVAFRQFVYDDEYECYTCEVDLDEDEMARFLQDKFYNCPYYQLGDEYRIVRKQM
ncbi:MAG: DUF6472 family protein [Clostridia bacterium]